MGDVAHLRLPVLSGDVALQPTSFWQLFRVSVERIAHAGDLAMLHSVRSGKMLSAGPVSPVFGTFTPLTNIGPVFNPSGIEVACSHIHRSAISDKRDSGSG
jgi:hypothetical protein